MTTTAPGWYDDEHGALRWWDGAQWTEHVATPDAEPVGPANGADPTGEGETAVLPPLNTHPGGYPGAAYPTDGGAFISATEPGKSKAWIVWVVLGVIVLGVVVALAVLLPVLFLNAASITEAFRNETEVLEAYEDKWEYVVVPTDDGWASDDASLS